MPIHLKASDSSSSPACMTIRRNKPIAMASLAVTSDPNKVTCERCKKSGRYKRLTHVGPLKPLGNPSSASVIYIRRKGNRGEFMWYDGKKFTNNRGPRYYGTRERAKAVARLLTRKYDTLHGYNVYVGPPNSTLLRHVRRNPEWRTQARLDEAARRLKDFSGHGVKRVIEVSPRSSEKTGLVIGELDLIGYRTSRVGIGGGKLVKYEHDFRHGSRPLLAVSTDGKQLHIVGGRYEFTEAGIEDR